MGAGGRIPRARSAGWSVQTHSGAEAWDPAASWSSFIGGLFGENSRRALKN